MTMDYNEVIIGFDLGYDSSVLTFYHQNNTEPMTVSSVPERRNIRFRRQETCFL